MTDYGWGEMRAELLELKVRIRALKEDQARRDRRAAYQRAYRAKRKLLK
jgi:hypothetical protein